MKQNILSVKKSKHGRLNHSWVRWLISIVSCIFFVSSSFSVPFIKNDNFSPLASAQNYSNKPIHWGLKRSTNQKPPSAGAEYEQILEKYDSFFLGDTSKKVVYLTFDNGYENGYTHAILDTLKEKQVPAIFFITGHYIKDQPDLVKRMIKEGHLVGNHSWHHPDFTEVSDQKLKNELESLKQEFYALTGSKNMNYLRPPRGIFSERTLALSRDLGYTNVFWSLAYIDWKTDQQRGRQFAYDQIMKQIHPGAILLLHSVSKDNAEALGQVIDDLHKQGYSFRSLDDLVIEKHGLPSEVIH
ncbi:delta-lactam-biosynthetic de-N-acetylase [Bacillus horti]|uniref:Peptidoglycan-N-acetylmuramic acid deacetylase n=1 Tax=Caldalkalibacillus horti TaxID=77523 RepID=A0ABT9W510_9BACI|nr:delta-lactam-biosynthetic de-N-acetylase [Bacillus horti]MDQ0168333.1 peptidoglycan-N-acetylmuramic acid deacetylase [Bacillus horti]